MLEAQKQRSEIARILEEIQASYEAGQKGLNGLASGVSRHEFLMAKTTRIGELHTELREIVGDDAIALVATALDQCSDQRKHISQKYTRSE